MDIIGIFRTPIYLYNLHNSILTVALGPHFSHSVAFRPKNLILSHFVPGIPFCRIVSHFVQSV